MFGGGYDLEIVNQVCPPTLVSVCRFIPAIFIITDIWKQTGRAIHKVLGSWLLELVAMTVSALPVLWYTKRQNRKDNTRLFICERIMRISIIIQANLQTAEKLGVAVRMVAVNLEMLLLSSRGSKSFSVLLFPLCIRGLYLKWVEAHPSRSTKIPSQHRDSTQELIQHNIGKLSLMKEFLAVWGKLDRNHWFSMSSETQLSDLGRELGSMRIKINRFIGAGGLGIVFESTLQSQKSVTKLDQIHNHEKWGLEYKILSSIQSRYVVKALAGETIKPGILRYNPIDITVLEYLNGQTLTQEMFSNGRKFTFEQIVKISAQIAIGIQDIHDAGIVHRDIKSDNIMMSGEAIKIIDFNTANWLSPDLDTPTGTNIFAEPGFFGLMGKNIKHGVRNDWYSLGITICLMATRLFPPDPQDVHTVQDKLKYLDRLKLWIDTQVSPSTVRETVKNMCLGKGSSRIMSLDGFKQSSMMKGFDWSTLDKMDYH